VALCICDCGLWNRVKFVTLFLGGLFLGLGKVGWYIFIGFHSFLYYIYFILITLKSDSACWVQDVLFISIIIEMEIPVVCVLIFIKKKKKKQIFCRSSSNCYIW